MYAMRRWSVRHSRFLEAVYAAFSAVLVRLEPVLRRIGYERLEPVFATTERGVKGFLFDCQMCGQCALSKTGLSCPMNCPKSLRNGPCGGVRENGMCEVKPEMRCVWVEAWEGSRRMRHGEAIRDVQFTIDHGLRGRSAWLREARQLAAGDAQDQDAARREAG